MEVNRTKSVIVIGDSNVRRLDKPIKNSLKAQDRPKVRVESVSGIGVDGLAARMATEVKREASQEVKVIAHVGTNDMTKFGSQVLLSKISGLIKTARDARSGVSVEVCEVPTRTDKGDFIYSCSRSVNCELAGLYREEWATCLSLGNYRLDVDGLHYSQHGATAASRSIAESITSFLV